MKWVTAILWVVAAILLILPALLQGIPGYALAVAAVSAAGIVLLRVLPQSKWSDVLLLVASVTVASALLLGMYPLFPVVSLMLVIYAWNGGHRFGHLDRSPIEPGAKQRFVLQQLALSLIPSFGIGLLLTAFLYVRIPLSFGLGLGLSTATFGVVALFIGFAHAARGQDD